MCGALFSMFEAEHLRFARRFANTIDVAYERFSWMEDELFRQVIGAVGMNFWGRIPWRI